MDPWKNQLFFGDNLDILRQHIPIHSVDLIYLDPPFNSNATYNVLFSEKTAEKSAAQITAFEDTWHWGAAEAVYHDVVTAGPRKLADLLQALRSFLGQNDMMAYLTMMAVRLVEMHRVLKPTGSIYLHCDPTASHYLKLVLDAVFGPKFFRNEISWKRYSGHGNVKKRFGSVRDIIFFYTKSDHTIWNPQYVELNQDYVNNFFRHVEPETDRRYRIQNVTNPNSNRPNLTYEWNGNLRVWKWTKDKMQELHNQGRLIYSSTGFPGLKQYLDESKGAVLQDDWDDIPSLQSSTKERLGYPTQKPEALLERIIRASSNEGDLILDPFCGCGTAVVVAERLHRRWLGIDITHLAINLIKNRLRDTFKDDLAPYEIIGEPADAKSAEALALENRHQFEWWALSMVNAHPAQDKKKGADRGIDGIIVFLEAQGKYQKMLVSVKSGHVNAGMIRDLKGVLEREKAALGAFITLKPPTRPMREEAAAAGFYVPADFPEHRFPKLQILTVADLFSGKKLDYPRWWSEETFKKAARQRKGPADADRQRDLLPEGRD